MSESFTFYTGRRVSYDGALCTVRCLIQEGQITGTKGTWLGVEWDDPQRGKHNGIYKNQQYFKCRSSYQTVASFVRPSRKTDEERTVLEAIRYKYASSNNSDLDTVIISGKVAQEIGFDKVRKEQSSLEDLRVVVLDQLCVTGLTPRRSSKDAIRRARTELARTCPNIVELDLGYNLLETWEEIQDICIALPKLKILRLNGVRLRSLESESADGAFQTIRELHLNECLLNPADLLDLLGVPHQMRFPALKTLWLSQNELTEFSLPMSNISYQFESINTLYLENNMLTDLRVVDCILTIFPMLKHISVQSNSIDSFSFAPDSSDRRAPSSAYKALTDINLSENRVSTSDFIEKLPMAFPNLSSLRISRNPVYDTPHSSTPTANPAETNYYLTIARIPTLRTLNYTHITAREREEGEIYYLSVIEKEMKSTLSQLSLGSMELTKQKVESLNTKFPRYQLLCNKHDRESVIAQILASTSQSTAASILEEVNTNVYPAGSLASKVVNVELYSNSSKPTASTISESPKRSFIPLVPMTVPSSSLFALVARTLLLPPLSFELTYESPELDPVRDDLTTRSQLASNASKTSDGKLSYKEWGEWDVDSMVTAESKNPEQSGGNNNKEFWTPDGCLFKNNKKWRRRVIKIPMGMRAWGDYLDLDSNLDEKKDWKTIVLRVEPRHS